MNKQFTFFAILFFIILSSISSFAQTSVVMNEIYTRGTTANPDWIEIYNPTSSAIDLTGFKIYDIGGQSGTKPKKEFPSGTIVPANGFYVIVTDDSDPSGFGLSSNGEEVWLENASGTVIDDVTFPALATTESYGRQPDGGTWAVLTTITRGYSNVITIVNHVFLNEVYSRGTAEDPDWIELYNNSASSIDISGYKIYDIGGQSGTKPKKVFPNGSVIPANGFLVIVTDDSDTSGFGLSSSGETVWLENGSGTIIDSVVFPALQATESYSRIPDGENWMITATITKGSTNIYSTASYIVMNEIYSRGTSADPDWIELYNLSSSAIDLTGYKIYDNGGQTGTKPKKSFPNGATIPANGFYVIVTDDSDPDGSGFGLSSSGEEVWLEDAAGAVIDNVVFPAMDIVQSYGRYPDGTSNWTLSNFITKGLPNTLTDVEEYKVTDLDYNLFQNYPNPFNPSTTISYTIPEASQVTITLYNILGKQVAILVDEYQQAGKYSFDYRPLNITSGVYFYQIKAGNFTSTRKLMLLQ